MGEPSGSIATGTSVRRDERGTFQAVSYTHLDVYKRQGVGLALGAGAEAHAGDAVAALNGHTVGGEGPLVYERTMPQAHGALGPDALVAPEGVVRVDDGLDVYKRQLSPSTACSEPMGQAPSAPGQE